MKKLLNNYGNVSTIMIVLSLCLAVCCFIAGLPRVANAEETIDLPRTGQTTCYSSNGSVISCAGTGQDGDTLAGVEWPSPRFTSDNSTMTDNLTGLMWAKDASTPTVSSCTGGAKIWSNAINYVTCLNGINYLGYNDWRLPNRNQLESLVNAESSSPSSWLTSQGFSGLQSWYWSSTSYAVSTDNAWYVSMDYGYVGYASKGGNSGCAWPVRLGQ
ncbi:MAG: DUF1566 domain-containing protein [Candidatus Magnetoovum sp. WYHC-5]|nr:DUF1566 domain-containing protein [Candidatus Magnetoovum sp. WYHC-5]